MSEARHLTDDQFARFQKRTLEADELMAVDRHLALCDSCRERLWGETGAAERAAALRAVLSEHLNYDQVVAGAEGRANEAVERHLLECPMCRAEVEDLRKFQRAAGKVVRMPGRRPGYWYAAIAAGVVLAAGLAFWSFRREKPAEVAQTPPVLSEPPLAPDQEAAVKLAISTHRLPRPALLGGLITKPGVLLGAPGGEKSFTLLGPIGTVVLTGRPAFRWEPIGGAAEYVVAVFDEHFQKVAESRPLTSTEWTPEKSLAQGVYRWQVTAQTQGRTRRAPVPPAGEARFRVAPAEVVSMMDRARHEHPRNHLLLAVLLAEAGALDDAAAEVDALAATDPATATGLRESLANIRKQ